MFKLEDYEEKVVTTFSCSPDSVYVGVCPSSYDRLLLHGISQYLSLKSKSKSNSL
jgi:hypothetical protein